MIKDWDKQLNAASTLGFALAAVVSFHVAYLVNNCQFLFIVFFFSLFRLANAKSGRWAFYSGLGIGLAIYSPHLSFFWTLFQGGAIALWIVLSCWLGLFLLLGQICLSQIGLAGWACAAPFVWTGLEYFRSELYYLRFSWLNAGYAFSGSASLSYVSGYGVYGIGFVLMTLAVILAVFRRSRRPARIILGTVAVVLLFLPLLMTAPQYSSPQDLRVTGVQLEFPSPAQAIVGLDKAIEAFPETDLLVLSEYAFTEPIPNLVKNWCRKHGKYLVAGGEDPVPGSASKYFNTTFVVNPQGEIVFHQAKCVPVQFMKDGLAATNQTLWASPWGKLGFGICYDASYTRVTDQLVRQGAQALIFPTMDVVDWGECQHRLHGRIAPMRAAEYALPVFRLCSSGISQYVDPNGKVIESAPFAGDGAVMSAQIQLTNHGRMPPDRWVAKFSVGFTFVLAMLLAMECARQRFVASIIHPR